MMLTIVLTVFRRDSSVFQGVNKSVRLTIVITKLVMLAIVIPIFRTGSSVYLLRRCY